MFLWFFVVPELLPKGLGDWIKQMPPPWSSYLPAVLCLALHSVRPATGPRRDQFPAARSAHGRNRDGLTERRLPHRTLAQAFRIILPRLTRVHERDQTRRWR